MRHYQMDGVYNFRDFGGYASAFGGAVRRDALFRSAHLAQCREGDLDTIRGFAIHTVVDLRRPHERAAEPNRWHAGHQPVAITYDDDTPEDLPPHIQYLRDTPDLSAAHTRDYMRGTYRRMPFYDRHIDVFRRAFLALAEAKVPLLVHCAAGKDRTGLLVWLIHHHLGVSDEDRMTDYLATNSAVNLDGIAIQASRRFADRIGRVIAPDVLRPMVQVHEEYMAAALEAIGEEAGSVDNYLSDVLQLDALTLAQVRDHMLDRASEGVS